MLDFAPMTSPEWNRYARALPSIAAAVGRTPLVRLDRVTADVKPGDLLTQIAFDGRQGAQKSVDFSLLDASDLSVFHGDRPSADCQRNRRTFPREIARVGHARACVSGRLAIAALFARCMPKDFAW